MAGSVTPRCSRRSEDEIAVRDQLRSFAEPGTKGRSGPKAPIWLQLARVREGLEVVVSCRFPLRRNRRFSKPASSLARSVLPTFRTGDDGGRALRLDPRNPGAQERPCRWREDRSVAQDLADLQEGCPIDLRGKACCHAAFTGRARGSAGLAIPRIYRGSAVEFTRPDAHT